MSLRLMAITGMCILLLNGCGGGSSGSKKTTIVTTDFAVDASVVTGTLAPLWGDHYDLSITHYNHLGEAGYPALVAELQPRYWRASVGRWEVGHTPPTGGDSTVVAILQNVEREYYDGPNTLAGADIAANYDFTYLDAQLAAIISTGAQPFLCFDYMPFTLSSEQDPNNANNFNISDPGFPFATYSFSNGIRTAPPADNAVYARVVRNVIRHVRGLFAGATDYGIEYIEIGNEPDLLNAGPVIFPLFWTGNRTQFYTMYAAIAAEIDADASLTGIIKLGAGSFASQAFEPDVRFGVEFLGNIDANGDRLDFFSYHSYDNDPLGYYNQLFIIDFALTTFGLSPEIINAEWGQNLGAPGAGFDTIGHGLFRVKAMAIMEAFGVVQAHEALLRDPWNMPGILGLLETGPPAHKPVSYCYKGMNLMNGTLNALTITAPADTYVLAGKDGGDTKVVIVFVGDDPGVRTVNDVTITVNNLPWGAAACDVKRYEVSEATTTSGTGVELMDSVVHTNAVFTETVRISAGQLIIWEIIKQ